MNRNTKLNLLLLIGLPILALLITIIGVNLTGELESEPPVNPLSSESAITPQ